MKEEPIQKIDKLSTSYKFAKNSIYNVVGFIVTFPILILLTPYMLNVLGKAQFGIWAIAGVVTSYAQLSDMGMTTAIVKFVAEHWAKKEVKRISKVVSTAFFSFAVVGGVVTTSILIARQFIVINLLKVPPDMQSEALFVVSGVVIIFYFNLLFGVYNSVLIGLQRMDVTNAIMVGSRVPRALGMWIFLAAGLGLKGLIWNSAIFSALTIGANVFWAKRLTAGLQVSPFWFSFSELKGIVKYSANIFAAKLMGLLQDPINKIILAAYTSLPFVSFYEVGWRIKNMIGNIFTVGIAPLLPASSELQSLKAKEDLKRIYLMVSRTLYFFAVPIIVLGITMAQPVLRIWLGEGYKFAAIAMQFMLVGQFFIVIVSPQYVILQGIGKPQICTTAHIIAAIVNIVLSLTLVRIMGFYGVLIGGTFSLFISFIYLHISISRILIISWESYWRNIPIIGILGALFISFCTKYFFSLSGELSLFKLLLFCATFSLLYLLLLNFGKVANAQDKKNALKVLTTLKFW